LIIDGKRENVDTTSVTVEEMLRQVGKYDEIATGSLSAGMNTKIPAEGMDLDVTTSKYFTLHDGGKQGRMKLPARTDRDIVELRGTALGKDDIVTPSADAPLREGMHIDVVRVSKKDHTVERAVTAPEREIEDADLPEGE